MKEWAGLWWAHKMAQKKRVICAGSDNFMASGIRKGTFAIWKAGVDGNDYAPAITPKNHLDRVILHSDLDYIGVERTFTGSKSFVAGTYPSDYPIEAVNLGPHGKTGNPMLICEVSTNGIDYACVNGTTYTQAGIALRGRSFHIQVDATNVYATFKSVGTLAAETVYFKIHVLERTFNQSKPNNNIIAQCTPSYFTAAFGRFDTRRNYLQVQASGQLPDIIHSSGQTIKEAIGTAPEQIDIGFGNSFNNGNIPYADGYSTTWPPYIIQGIRAPLVFSGPGTVTNVSEFKPSGFKLSNSSGVNVFDSSRQMVAFVDEYKVSISVQSHPAIAVDVPHEIVHWSAPVPVGCDLIFAWMKITSADLFILSQKPTDISGSLFIFGWWYVQSSKLHVRAATYLTVRIKDGYVQIVEHYRNKNMAGSDNLALPAYTADLQIFTCMRTGGA